MATRDETLRLKFETTGVSNLRDLSRQLSDLGKNADANTAELDQFADELERLGKADASLRGLVQAKARLTELRPALEQARERLVQLQLEFNKEPGKKLGQDLERARKSVRDLTAEQNRLTASLTPNTAVLQKLGLDTKNLDSAQRQLAQNTTDLQTRVRSYSAALKEAGGAGGALAKGLRETQAAAKSTAPDLGAVQAGLGRIAVAAAGAVAAFKSLTFGGSLVGEAARLQQGLAEVAAVAGGTAEDLAQLQRAAQDAAQATGQSVGDITAGLGDLARTGLDTEAAIAALGPSLDLAAAGGIALQQSVDIVTTTLAQFGFNAEEAARIANVLSSAANATNSSVEGLGRSLTDVAPLSNQLGISLEDTVAILGRLADAGFRGERAGTALRSVFSQLLDPSSKFREALGGLGIEGNDFAGILEQLATRGEAGKQALLTLGQEAAPAILALSQQGSASIRELAAQLQNAEGAAGRVASIVRDTLSTAFARLQQTAGIAATGLLDGLLKPLQDTLQTVQARLQAFIASPQFDQLRQRLTTAFEDGLGAVNRFLEGLDFADAIEAIDKLARSASDLFTDFETKATNAANAINTISAAFNAIVSAGDAANAALEQLNLQAARYGAEVRKSSIQLAGIFQDVSADIAKVDAEIAELARKEAEAGQRRARFWQEAQRAAAEYRGEVAQAEASAVDFGRLARTAIGPLADVVADVAGEFGNIRRAAADALPDIDRLGIETENAAKAGTEAARGLVQALPEIVPAAQQAGAAASQAIGQIGPAGVESAKQLLAGFEQAAQAIQIRMNQLILEIAQAVANGQPTAPLEAELQRLQEEFARTETQVRRLKDVLEDLGTPPTNSNRPLLQLQSDAEGAGQSLDKLGQQSKQAAKQISGTSAQLDALNARFREARAAAEELGSAALESFDRLFRNDGIIRTTGRGTADVLQLIADRSKNATAFVDELARAMGDTEASAKRAAEAFQQAVQQSADAVRDLSDLTRQLQDERDRLAGNEEAIRRRQFEEQLRRIAELERQGGQSAIAQAQQARRLAQEVFEEDLRLIREREREQNASDDRIANRRRSGSSAGGSGTVDRGQPQQTQPETLQPRREERRQPIEPEPARAITLNFQGPVLGSPEEFARLVRREIDKMDRRGFNPRTGL
jgi:TP901 family phage tail tape measure protein